MVKDPIGNSGPKTRNIRPAHQVAEKLCASVLSAKFDFYMKPGRSSASDNNAGIHSEVIEAFAAANRGHTIGYGDDPYTESAVRKFKQHFGAGIQVFFVFNGTAANCLSLKAFTESYNAVICGDAAHIYVDECGAPEKFTGCKLISISTIDGKLTVDAV